MKFITLFTAALLAGSGAVYAQSTPPAATGTTTTTPAPAAPDSSSGATGAVIIPGANSFTETQARERIETAGYTKVGALTKSSDGFWRGEATKSGASVRISVDFKGNVVAM